MRPFLAQAVQSQSRELVAPPHHSIATSALIPSGLRPRCTSRMAISSCLASAAMAVLVFEVQASMYLAELCRGHRCDQPGFPMIEYSEETQSCYCSAHPCWNDDGVSHSCPEGKYLFFQHDPHNGNKLKCACTEHAVYVMAQSQYIYKEKCPGQLCGDQTPILEWSEEEQSCFCRTHPCHNQQVGNQIARHDCHPESGTPHLKYREEANPDGSARPICECQGPLVPPGQAIEEM
jgi:hypothetical protein